MNREEVDNVLLRLHIRARLDRSAMRPEGTDFQTIARNRDNHRRELSMMGLTWPHTN